MLAALLARGQLSETFSDSNFTAAPPWTGSPGAWTVNAQKQLQSTSAIANSTFYLGTPAALAGNLQWKLWMRLAFATSSVNYSDIWILSHNANPEAPGNTGYFVRVGGTQDDICLYRKDAAATVRIIDGPDGVTGSSDNQLQLQVIRSGGSFSLRHASNGGSFVTDGQATDGTYPNGGYFALLVRQSTSSFFGRHYFDDIRIGSFVPDTLAPSIRSVRAPDDSTVEIRFDEPVDAASAANPGNYSLSGIGAALRVQPDPSDGALWRLHFAAPLPADTALLLRVQHIRDAWGNELVQDSDLFRYHPTARYDVLIHEFLADPDPPRELPPYEYVELRNRCHFPVCLKGWTFATATSQSAPLPDYWLEPDSFLILTSTAGAAFFHGSVLGLSGFPALANEGGLLQLLDAGGRTVHALTWTRDWYRDALKDDGGWSLELRDTANPCGGAANWAASEDPRGGTPGGANSVAGPHPYLDAPRLLRTFAPDSLTILAEFSEPLDSTRAATAVWLLGGGPAVQRARALPPLFCTVELQLAAPLRRGKLYELVADGACDCSGNGSSLQHRAPVGLAEEASAGIVVINELLYQPHTGGAEYVELYSRDRVVDLSKLFLATRNSSGALGTPKRLSETQRALFPGAYLLVTADSTDVSGRYFVAQPDWLEQLTGLPALPDEGGTVVLLNDRGVVLDEVHYDPAWQFGLINDAHGVSLERMDPLAASGERGNWHSAASTAGFGTPTARNSQARGGAGEGTFTVTPAVFSPDNDGFDDVTMIHYELEESGYVANIALYDAAGRPVHALVRNDVLGRSGGWSWDGLDAAGRLVPAGTYVLLAELFNLEGKRSVFKRTITVARKLR
ncbi:hypothetical protein GCM10028786_21260 [Flaviaesturariibacter terrae]